MKKCIATQAAPAAVGPYSQGVQAGNVVYLSGQLGIDPATGKLAEGGVAAQARQSLTNVLALLDSLGASPEQVVKTTVFLTDMADFQTVNAEYAKVFSRDCPARSCVAVKALPLGGLVEIEAIVAL
ncbi:MAG: reactive intermediate/imine deaminase [Desulfovibrionaceae bacterium]|nr:reactive intermediate/imine deaminase [Desulfovibrionaceae bacterium]